MKGNQINKGRKLSEEHKAKISYASSHISEETRKKLADASRGNKYSLGFIHSEETRKKMSDSQRRAMERNPDLWAQKSRQMIGNKNNLDHIASAEARKHMSEAQKKAAPKKRYHRICIVCGIEFLAKGPNKQRCLACDN